MSPAKTENSGFGSIGICRQLSLITRYVSIRGMCCFSDGESVGILRYNLFWDNTPFCTMLYVDPERQQHGYGRKLMVHWENEMKRQGYGIIMTSTQVDEPARHFYRKPGHKDCGGLTIDIPGYEQPMELLLSKKTEIWEE